MNDLELMFVRQYGLQAVIANLDVLTLDGDARVTYIEQMYVALTKELGEALDEISWKPWATGQFFNREAYLKELVDALHFWMNLVMAAGAPNVESLVNEVVELYFRKADVNQKRSETGYDGVSSKCSCGRDIQDGTGEGTTNTSQDKLVYIYQCPCGRYNGLEVERD